MPRIKCFHKVKIKVCKPFIKPNRKQLRIAAAVLWHLVMYLKLMLRLFIVISIHAINNGIILRLYVHVMWLLKSLPILFLWYFVEELISLQDQTYTEGKLMYFFSLWLFRTYSCNVLQPYSYPSALAITYVLIYSVLLVDWLLTCRIHAVYLPLLKHTLSLAFCLRHKNASLLHLRFRIGSSHSLNPGCWKSDIK